ncbi:MAG: hypothetical protein FVQ85_14570 [Planctomycetes bacterium]|nr:hypothetical protein [Planctomycetota bacterium]
MIIRLLRLFSVSVPFLCAQKHILHKLTGTKTLFYFLAAGLSLALVSFQPAPASASSLNSQETIIQSDANDGPSIEQTGSLQVTIQPQEAIDANAQWRVDSGIWHDSNDIVTDLAVGSHTIEYKQTCGWNEPPGETIGIYDSQMTLTTGTYTLQRGSLKIMIFPIDANDAGAQARIDGGPWRDNDYTEPNLLVCRPYTVEFKPIPDWKTPDTKILQVYDEQTTIAAGLYIPTGSLQITILPPEANDAGAQWRVDGGTWHDSNDIETELTTGSHTLEYKTIFGFSEPNSETVQINHGLTTTATGTYLRQFSSLQVIISPQAAVDQGAQWRVDGRAWHDSNDTEPNLAVAFHTVEYKPITNWNEPNSETLLVNYGPTTIISGTYIQTGSLQVTISPPQAIDNGAQWRIDGGPWHDSNDTQTNLAIGMHTIEYKQISNWNEPNSQTVQINFGQTTSASGTYLQSGSLQVTIYQPEAIDANDANNAGAQWRVDDGPWHDSNDIITNLLVGSHIVEYKPIYGWNEPNNQTVQINHAQITTATGTYIRQRGSLQVTILPQEPVAAGAQWRVDGGIWHDSNDTEPNLAVGLHTVEYKQITNWIEPNNHTVQIDYLQTTTISKAYIRAGAVQITISPPEVVDAGAKWRVDSGPWRNSNSISRPLPVGQHTVDYKPLFNWNEPNSHTVQINYGQTTTTTGTYIRQFGSLQVTISPTEAIVAGAMWRVDGGTWRDSNDIEIDLNLGFHTVEYKSAGSAWMVPANEYVQIIYNQTAITTVTYIKRTPSGAPPLLWQTTFGGSDWDFGESVYQTSDGGYITVGNTYSDTTFDYDIYLIKSEPNGALQWQKTFGGSDWDRAYSVQQTSDAGYIIAGSTYSVGNGESDVYLLKLDSSGNKDWDKYFGGAYWDEGYSVQETSDGGFIVVGLTYSSGAGEYDVYLIKTQSNGNKQYEKTFGGTGDENAWSVRQTSDGGYIIVGYTESFGAGGRDVYMIKTDSATVLQWQKTFDRSNDDIGYSVQQTPDGGYIIAGYTSDFCPFQGTYINEMYLIKTEPNGTLMWENTYPGSLDFCSGDEIAYSAQQTSDGGYIITGETQSYGLGNGNIYLVKTDPIGNMLWQKVIGDTALDYAMAVQQTTDDGFIIAGTTYSPVSMDYDMYLAKICPDGTSAADFNCDGIVFFEDLEILLSQWLLPPTSPSADIYPETGDGLVNGFDFKVLAHDWLLETITP